MTGSGATAAATRPAGETGGDWRRTLWRGIAWLLVAKLVALILLKTAFFSAASRLDVTPDVLHERLAPAAPAAATSATVESDHDRHDGR